MVARINHMTTKTLSYLAKIILIHIVQDNMKSYWAQLLCCQKKPNEENQKYLQIFFFIFFLCGYRLLVNAQGKLLLHGKIFTSQDNVEEINLKSFVIWNKVIVIKQLQAICHKNNKFQVQLVHTYYVFRLLMDARKLMAQRELVHHWGGWLHIATKRSYSIQASYKN